MKNFSKKVSKLNSRMAVRCSLNSYSNHLLIITEEKQKLKKLPPDRVGANFDHSSSTTAGWLPSFGRVWNNGRRWQSRYGSCAWTPTYNPFGKSLTFALLSLHFLSGINSKLKM